MRPAMIVKGETDLGDRRFRSSTHNTGLSQRETIEESLCNLAAVFGAEEIQRITSSRGSLFYKIQTGDMTISYQSASNVILELSRHLLERAKLSSPSQV